MRASSFLLALALATGSACDSASSPPVCTAEYRELLIKVYDLAGNPVTGVSLHDSIPRTGQALTPNQVGFLPTGTYVGFEDLFKNQIRQAGDTVLLFGDKGQSQFGVLWIVDAPGGCHVHKAFGADSILLP